MRGVSQAKVCWKDQALIHYIHSEESVYLHCPTIQKENDVQCTYVISGFYFGLLSLERFFCKIEVDQYNKNVKY